RTGPYRFVVPGRAGARGRIQRGAAGRHDIGGRRRPASRSRAFVRVAVARAVITGRERETLSLRGALLEERIGGSVGAIVLGIDLADAQRTVDDLGAIVHHRLIDALGD